MENQESAMKRLKFLECLRDGEPVPHAKLIRYDTKTSLDLVNRGYAVRLPSNDSNEAEASYGPTGKGFEHLTRVLNYATFGYHKNS